MKRMLIAICFALAFPATAHAGGPRPFLSHERALGAAQKHSHYFAVAGCVRHSHTRFLCRVPLAAGGEGAELVGNCWDVVKLRGGTVHDRTLRCRGHWTLTTEDEAATVEAPNERSQSA